MKRKERVIDFVAEAEKIICDYIEKNDVSSQPVVIPTTRSIRSRLWDFVLNILMTIGCLIITAILVWGLFG